MNRHTAIALVFAWLAFTCIPHVNAEDKTWSEPVNGVQAQLTLKAGKIVNETPIVPVYLSLRNVSDVANPLELKWNEAKFVFRVLDENGKEPPPTPIAYDGMIVELNELILPYDSELTFVISQHGLGIPAGKAALIDLGPPYCWIIDKTEKKYFLHGTLEIPKLEQPSLDRSWRGKIELPKVEIPLVQ